MNDFPWFPFYVESFISSRAVRRMTAAEVGAYVLLLVEEWMYGPMKLKDAEAVSRLSPEETKRVLKMCFHETPEGWVNTRLEQVREQQKMKRARRVAAGRKGGRKKAENRRKKGPKKSPQNDVPQQHASNALAKLKQSPSNIELEVEVEDTVSSVAIAPSETGAVAPIAIRFHERWGGQAVVGLWIDARRVLGLRDPAESVKRRQGAVAKRLASAHDQAAIVRAIIGMDALFPYGSPPRGRGEPWDLFTLERQFQRAYDAAEKHPRVRELAFDREFGR